MVSYFYNPPSCSRLNTRWVRFDEQKLVGKGVAGCLVEAHLCDEELGEGWGARAPPPWRVWLLQLPRPQGWDEPRCLGDSDAEVHSPRQACRGWRENARSWPPHEGPRGPEGALTCHVATQPI